MKYLFPIIIASIGLYVSSCANQGSPQGGPRDTIPPILLTSFPESKTLNYTDKEFRFEFDERISVDQLISKLIITPRTEIKFKSFVKKNKMTLTFEENFGDSTTYTLNFSDGVVDITEKNPVENFSFAFSTGPVIDSIYIKGNVKDLYNNEDQKNILIALFDITDTLNIFTGKPKYFTKTSESGNFQIENIKNGYYKLYAFLDDDNNLINDPTKESHGFMSDTLDLNISRDSVDIKVQLIDASLPKFVRAKHTGQYFDILYSKYCKAYTIEKVDSTSLLPIPANNLFKENTILRFYKDSSFRYETDSLQLIINFSDSLNNKLTDTTFVKFKESKRKPEQLTMKILPVQKSIQEKFKIQFNFSKPIEIYNSDSIILKYDTLKVINLPDSIFRWNENKTQLTIPVKVDKTTIPKQIELHKKELAIADSINSLTPPDSLNQPINLSKEDLNEAEQLGPERQRKQTRGLKNQIVLQVKNSAFISIEDDSTKLETAKYSFINEQEFGTLSGTIQTTTVDYFLQLTDPTYKVVKELKDPKKFTFNSVKPGKYTFRILIDKNGDGKWSPGNILQNIEPEPIWFYSEVFDLRANWVVENLDISF